MEREQIAAADPAEVSVGMRLRALRRIRGISLQTLARETGMSYSYLSGLENGKHSVSIANLQRLAGFFQVDLVWFLMPEGPASMIFRMDDLFRGEGLEGVRYRVITPEDSENLQVSYVHLPPHEPKQHKVHRHSGGQEMVLVLEGCLYIRIGEEKLRLVHGDCILFAANREHILYTEEQPATFVITSSPPYGLDPLALLPEEKRRGADTDTDRPEQGYSCKIQNE